MDIKLPDSTLRKFLQTKAPAEKIAETLTLCGPSVERLHKATGNYVYDIEAITNRVDSASAFGIAREAAAILPLFGLKAKLINNPYDIQAGELPERKSPKLTLEIIIKDETLVKRFAAIVLDGLVVKDSPQEIITENKLTDINIALRRIHFPLKPSDPELSASPTMPFTDHTKQTFAYEVGAGLQYLLWDDQRRHVQYHASAGYQYFNLDRGALGRSLAQTSPERLKVKNLYTQGIIFTLAASFG